MKTAKILALSVFFISSSVLPMQGPFSRFIFYQLRTKLNPKFKSIGLQNNCNRRNFSNFSNPQLKQQLLKNIGKRGAGGAALMVLAVGGVWGFNALAKEQDTSDSENNPFQNNSVSADDDKTEFAEFEKFTERYPPDDEIKKLIEDNEEFIKSLTSCRPCGKVGGPIIFVRDCKIDRIINSIRLERYIKKEGLDCFGVPKKYIYQVDGEWRVFAEYIDGLDKYVLESDIGGATKFEVFDRDIHGERVVSACLPFSLVFDNIPFTIKKVQQLVQLAEETGYKHWHHDSLITEKNSGKTIIVDTKDSSFFESSQEHYSDRNSQKRDYCKNCCCDIRTWHFIFGYSFVYDSKPRDWMDTHMEKLLAEETWIDKFINKFKKKPEIVQSLGGRQSSTKFDDPDIDFEKVKDQFRIILCEQKKREIKEREEKIKIKKIEERCSKIFETFLILEN